MPIIAIVQTPFAALLQQCGKCPANTFIPRDKLSLGFLDNPDLIAMPVCASCGAQEFLHQSFDEAPEDLAAHRSKVNALALSLKKAGQISEGLKSLILGDTRTPRQVSDLIGPVTTPPTDTGKAVDTALGVFESLKGRPRGKSIVDSARLEKAKAISKDNLEAQKREASRPKRVERKRSVPVSAKFPEAPVTEDIKAVAPVGAPADSKDVKAVAPVGAPADSKDVKAVAPVGAPADSKDVKAVAPSDSKAKR